MNEITIRAKADKKGDYMKYILIPIYIFFTIAGLVLMKQGGNPGTLALKAGTFNISMSMVSAIGFLCYILSFFLFTRLVVMFDLSFIYPLTTGIVQVVTLVISYLWFKEKISLTGIIGASLVIIGIIVMNLKTPSKVENNKLEAKDINNIVVSEK